LTTESAVLFHAQACSHCGAWRFQDSSLARTVPPATLSRRRSPAPLVLIGFVEFHSSKSLLLFNCHFDLLAAGRFCARHSHRITSRIARAGCRAKRCLLRLNAALRLKHSNNSVLQYWNSNSRHIWRRFSEPSVACWDSNNRRQCAYFCLRNCAA